MENDVTPPNSPTPAPNKGGRPSKMTDAAVEAIVKALQGGNTRKASAEYAGVGYSTFRQWERRFPKFLAAVTRAEAECEVRNVAILNQAANGYQAGEKTTITRTIVRMEKITLSQDMKQLDGTVIAAGSVIEKPVSLNLTTTRTTERMERDWRAGLEWLKRRNRDDWGDKNETRLTGDDTQPITFFTVHAPPGQSLETSETDE